MVEASLAPDAGPRRSWVPPRLDALIAAAFVALVVAEAVLSPDVPSPALHVAVAGSAMLTLAWRRRFPLAVAALVMGANLALNPEGQFSTLLSIVVVTFTVGAETAAPRSYVGLGLVLVPFVGLLALEGLEPSDLAAGLVFMVGPWAVGQTTRRRAERADEAVERADRLERERELQTAAAAAEERTRIARELHDIISHSISVVTVQTQAVRRRLGPEHAREAADLADVEATAREAMVEMRRLFGVLRSAGDTVSLAPQPGLGQLAALLDQVRATGLGVELTTQGDPYELSPGIDLTAYRIVQETVTNALRHSGGSRVTVILSYEPAHLRIAVEDDGHGWNGTGPPGPRTAHGLIGVRERVSLYGGTLEISSGAGGGARLDVVLPSREPT